MIYVLFGPPGVGKTYLGQLLGRELDIPFFDADTLIDAEEMRLLQEGAYDQEARDRFVIKLIRQTQGLVGNNNQNLIIAEAFTKEKNRLDFMQSFDGKVMYVKVDAPKEIALLRAKKRLRASKHTINDVAFELIWDEFESPHFLHLRIDNDNISDDRLVSEFANLVKLHFENKKNGGDE